MIRSPLVRSLLVPLALLTLPLQAQEKAARPKSPRDPEAILRGLGQGIEALQALGAHDEAERVARIARELKQKLAGEQNREDAAGKQQLEVMRVAQAALREAERHDALELLERAMHVRELALEGRKAPDVKSPDRASIAKVLALAAELYQDWNKPDRAEMVAKLARTFAGKADVAGGEHDHVEHSHQSGKQELETFVIGVKELAGAGWEKGAHELELALHAHKLRLAQLTDDEAQKALAQAPPAAAQARWLAMAAELAQRAGRNDHAGRLAKASQRIQLAAKESPARARQAPDEIGALAEDLRRMQAQLAELQARLEKLVRQPR
jgi:hypothetical protein